MSSCFATGGPDWLFPLLLGNGLAALVCLILVLALAAPPPARTWRNRSRRQLVALAVGVGLGLAMGLPWLHLMASYVPLVVVGVVLRSAGQPAAVTATETTGAAPARATPVVLGGLTGTVAVGALAAMVLQGGPC